MDPNERLRLVLDWLYKNSLVSDQQDLAAKTGLSEKAISQILNNKVKKISEATIRKINDAFGNVFNPAFLRGQSIIMLAEDELYFSLHPEKNPLNKQQDAPAHSSVSPVELPAWADTLISILSEQIKQNEALNRELRRSIDEIHALRDELLRSSHQYSSIPQHPSLVAEP